MEFPVTINDQAGFDELVKSRLERERSKFADYDELKAKVDTLAKERDEATAKAEKALADFTQLQADQKAAAEKAERERELGQWRDDVAKATGVPADVLVGSTREELEQFAEKLKPHITKAPYVPDPGKTPDRSPANDAETQFVRELFGSE